MTAYSLERVLARTGGGVTLRHVRAMCAEGLAQRFVADDGSVVVTQVIDEPGQTVLGIWLAEGQMAGCMECLGKIEDYARKIGARVVRVTGRAGWVRQLQPRGYVEVARVLERVL